MRSVGSPGHSCIHRGGGGPLAVPPRGRDPCHHRRGHLRADGTHAARTAERHDRRVRAHRPVEPSGRQTDGGRRPAIGLGRRVARARTPPVDKLRDPAHLRPGECRRPAEQRSARGSSRGPRSHSAWCSGLVVGKTVGITAFAWLAVRTRAGELPEGATWPSITGVAAVAGIGFTVAIFIAGLAFEDPGMQDLAKIGILGGSLLAAVLGALLLRSTGPDRATSRRLILSPPSSRRPTRAPHPAAPPVGPCPPTGHHRPFSVRWCQPATDRACSSLSRPK